MRFRQPVLIALCLALVASPALAAEKKHDKQHEGKHDSKMDQQAMMEQYQKLATPGEPHKQLASLAGAWTTQTKEWHEPGKPPSEAAGTAEMKMVLDGRFLQQEYHSTMMGRPYSGIGTTGYDNMRNRYITTWIDTMGTGVFTMEGTGSPDGKTITMKGSHPTPDGGQMHHRAVWKIVDDKTQTFEMYGSHDGQDMKMMEITYTRK